MNLLLKSTAALATVLVAAGAVASFKSTVAVQRGFPGVGMEQIDEKENLVAKTKANAVPPAFPAASTDGKLAVDAYKNVQVLGHIPSGEFTRLMTAITIWVSPNEGCAYCHAPQRDEKGNIVRGPDGSPQADLNNMQSDELYTKRVARRMLQMTMRINGDWQEHVKATGVTCYTCHRGNPVPTNIWFDEPESPNAGSMLGNKAGQNSPSTNAALTSLPGAALRPYLAGTDEIRVQTTDALGTDNRSSIKQTEWTYAFMLHISKSLGVNCTYCHNTRSMAAWDVSPATRTTAWYGIRMVRELNKDYLEPLQSSFPANRLGPLGDSPKASCATCHAGAYKPLLGVSMLKDYTALASAKPQPAKTPDVAPDPVPPSALDAGAAALIEAGALPLATGDGGARGDAGAGSVDAGGRGALPRRP